MWVDALLHFHWWVLSFDVILQLVLTRITTGTQVALKSLSKMHAIHMTRQCARYGERLVAQTTEEAVYGRLSFRAGLAIH